jgi:protein MpaA
MHGLPVSWATSADGRRAYTLYSGDERASRGGAPFIQVIDTVAATGFRLDLPGLERRRNLFLLKLRVEDGGRTLAMLARSPRQGGPSRRVMEIDTTGLHSEEPVAAASSEGGWLSFARAPRRPGNLLKRFGTIGYSGDGRPIHLRQVGDPAIDGHLLVFGCIHGDECGVAERAEPLANGCPDPRVDVFIVPNLDPDGAAAGSRLNGNGVDLNRNFPSHWRPAGSRGDPEYPGPRPFSEPESRLAARLIRALRPKVTIWFHEHHARRPLVRAWGPSLAAGRRFARLAGMPFHAIPWPAGTAPNWQNSRFPGAASFVVELPRARPGAVTESRLDRAVDLIAREVAKD